MKKVKAFLLWYRGEGTSEGPGFVDAYKTKQLAQRRIKMLVSGASWRKTSDYDIRQGYIEKSRVKDWT